jgi:hypothetical protein
VYTVQLHSFVYFFPTLEVGAAHLFLVNLIALYYYCLRNGPTRLYLLFTEASR